MSKRKKRKWQHLNRGLILILLVGLLFIGYICVQEDEFRKGQAEITLSLSDYIQRMADVAAAYPDEAKAVNQYQTIVEEYWTAEIADETSRLSNCIGKEVFEKQIRSSSETKADDSYTGMMQNMSYRLNIERITRTSPHTILVYANIQANVRMDDYGYCVFPACVSLLTESAPSIVSDTFENQPSLLFSGVYINMEMEWLQTENGWKISRCNSYQSFVLDNFITMTQSDAIAASETISSQTSTPSDMPKEKN